MHTDRVLDHACTAPECGQPSPDGWICSDCVGDTRVDLETCEWLWTELELTRTRQGNTAKDRVRVSRAGDRPLPWVPAAADAATDLARAVRELAVALGPHSSTGDIFGALDPGYPSTPPLVEWLLTELDALPRLPAVGSHLRRLDSARERGMGVIDHPDDKVFLGRCGGELPRGAVCAAELMAVVGEAEVVCWRCKRLHDVSDRQDEMMWRAREYVAHAGRLASLLTLMGVPTADSTVRGYASRRGLTVISTDAMRRPCYRMRDVMALRMVSFGRERARLAKV